VSCQPHVTFLSIVPLLSYLLNQAAKHCANHEDREDGVLDAQDGLTGLEEGEAYHTKYSSQERGPFPLLAQSLIPNYPCQLPA
jgi:hypothetical protein